MFSARNKEAGKNDELFVINGSDVFFRKIKNNVFHYYLPEDGDYNLEYNVNISVKEGKIVKISGKYPNVASDNVIVKSSYKDEFYTEKSLACDEMKFDIINTIFVKKSSIKGFQTQLYIPDYYELLKLVFYLSEDEKKRPLTKVFVYSEKMEIGCAYYKEYKVYKKPVEEYDGKKKKKKKKKIVAKTRDEFLKKVSEESYKKMLLDDYVYLQPFQNGDINKIVLYVEGERVRYLNAMAIDLTWKELTKEDLVGKQDMVTADKPKSKKTKKKKSRK